MVLYSTVCYYLKGVFIEVLAPSLFFLFVVGILGEQIRVQYLTEKIREGGAYLRLEMKPLSAARCSTVSPPSCIVTFTFPLQINRLISDKK